MEKRIALFMSTNYMFDFSRREMSDLKLTQKSLWRLNYKNPALRILRNINDYTVQCVLNLSHGEYYDVAVISDTEITPCALHYIIRHPIAEKQYIYFFNKITDAKKYVLEMASSAGITVLTYNLSDSKKYQIKYHNQCWNTDFIKPNIGLLEYDMIFLGVKKGRYEQAMEIIRYAKENNLNSRFIIVSNKKEPYTTKNRIPYADYINLAKKSRSIVDLVTEDNYGLTYRPLEAIFLKKKLITNYIEIKQYDFYESYKKNIFIIGESDLNALNDFLKRPFVDSYPMMERYDIEYWIKGLI